MRRFMITFNHIEADTMEEAVGWARLGRFMVGSNEVREIFAAPF